MHSVRAGVDDKSLQEGHRQNQEDIVRNEEGLEIMTTYFLVSLFSCPNEGLTPYSLHGNRK